MSNVSMKAMLEAGVHFGHYFFGFFVKRFVGFDNFLHRFFFHGGRFSVFSG